MLNSHEGEHLKLSTPAAYRIEVEGEVPESWFDRLGGMRITTRQRANQTTVTTLIGRVRDQAQLTEVLNSLYELHLPILSVENLSEDNGEVDHDPGQSSPSESQEQESTK